MRKILCNRKMLAHVAKAVVTCFMVGMACTGCLESKKEILIVMRLSTEELNFPSSGGQQSFTITSNTNYWRVSNNAPSLLRISSRETGSENGTVTITAEANTANTPQQATLTVSGTGFEKRTINVIIAGTNTTPTPTPTLNVSVQTLNFGDAGEGHDFTITSNTNWTVASSADWLTVSPSGGSNNGTVSVTARPNTNTTERTATVTVSGEGVPVRTINIIQGAAAYILNVSPTSLDFNDFGGQQQTITIESNVNWSASSDAQGWLTVSPSSGSAGNRTVTVTATTGNTSTTQRTATITVTGGSTTRTVSVKQAGVAPILSLSTSSLSFTNVGEQQSFTVTSNTNWSIVSNVPNWLTISPLSGSNTGTVRVTASANTSANERTAAIDVNAEGIVQSLIVTQAGTIPTASLSVSTWSLHFPITDGQQSFNITSNTNWYIGSNASWITVSPSSGSNNRTVTVSVTDNSYIGSPPRTAIVVIINSGTGVVLHAVVVTQQAPFTEAGLNWTLPANIRGNLSNTGILSFSTTATNLVAMPDYTSSSRPPWYAKSSILWVDVRNNIAYIGNWAFASCPNLVSATLTNTLTTIGNNAFRECPKLALLKIPSSVTSIGNNAFESCTSLQAVYVEWTTPLSVSQNIFSGINLSDVTLFVPRGTGTRYREADVWKSFGSIVEN